ncbi:hypothetical protein F0562_022038 [Nyssa sinensis]|uniref:Uncharacterized protein n=1 Tax=Nyssa sinensis TaxID=561372 RepID=A0A5J5BKX4_9ASTE|nr:hypothetical protein F0562_022038 [Nyssa sinensis]
MGSPIGWDNRIMFERYLYDYFRKKNMHETAEIFREEANLTIYPMTSPVVDVPDGFLHEWWSIFYDMFNAWQPKNTEHYEGPSCVAEQVINMGSLSDLSSLEQHKMTEQMMREPTVSTNFGFTIGDFLVPPARCPLTGTEQISQGLTSSRPQQKSFTLTPEISSHLGDLSDIVAQGIGSSGLAAPRKENIAPHEGADIIHPGFENHELDSLWVMKQYQEELLDKSSSLESGRKRKNSSSYSEDGSNGVPTATNCPSETSSPIHKCLKDIVKRSTSHADDDKDEGRTSSSNLQTHHTTPDTDASKDGILLGGILVNYKFHNFMETILLHLLLET